MTTNELAMKLTKFADNYGPYEFMGDEGLLNGVYESNVELLEDRDESILEWLCEILGYAEEDEDERLQNEILELAEDVKELYGQ